MNPNSPQFYSENTIINNVPEYSNQVQFNSQLNNQKAINNVNPTVQEFTVPKSQPIINEVDEMIVPISPSPTVQEFNSLNSQMNQTRVENANMQRFTVAQDPTAQEFTKPFNSDFNTFNLNNHNIENENQVNQNIEYNNIQNNQTTDIFGQPINK